VGEKNPRSFRTRDRAQSGTMALEVGRRGKEFQQKKSGRKRRRREKTISEKRQKKNRGPLTTRKNIQGRVVVK